MLRSIDAIKTIIFKSVLVNVIWNHSEDIVYECNNIYHYSLLVCNIKLYWCNTGFCCIPYFVINMVQGKRKNHRHMYQPCKYARYNYKSEEKIIKYMLECTY